VKKKFLLGLLIAWFSVGAASAQIGSSVVYDPTNYQNAVLRYHQLEQHLIELQKTYDKITSQLSLAMQMATFIRNMPARYRALFSQWRNVTSPNTFGNTGSWVSGINSGQFPAINTGYQKATAQLSKYDPFELSGMDGAELGRVQSEYASIELADGANENAMATIGSIRGSAGGVESQISNLDEDSFSDDAGLNSEVSVLNKINASNVLTLHTVQDSNKLLASLLELETILAKQQRDSAASAINTDIGREATMAGNMAQFSSSLTNSLQSFRMP
jgi:hypothetical protein